MGEEKWVGGNFDNTSIHELAKDESSMTLRECPKRYQPPLYVIFVIGLNLKTRRGLGVQSTLHNIIRTTGVRLSVGI